MQPKLKSKYKLRQFGPRFLVIRIPEDWESNALSKFSKITVGHVGPTSEYYADDGVIFLRTQNVKEGLPDLNDVKYITKEFHQKLQKSQLHGGEILISRVGISGVACLIPDDFPEANCANVLILRVNDKLNSRFLCYFLNSSISQKQVTAREAGGVQLVLNAKTLEKITIPILQLPEQQKIASILSNIDSLIQQTQNEIEYTQRFKKGLMQKLLTKGIGHTKFKKIKWNYGKLLEIPENWNVVLLDKVAKRGSGHTPDAKIPEYYDGEIKWISLADSKKLDNVYISETEKEISEKGIKNSSAVKHPAGIVVLSRDAGVGKSAITTTEMAVSQHFMAWQCGDELNNHFLYYLLQFWKPLFESIAIGTTIKTIGLPFFKKFKIILPSRKEQDTIALILLNIDKSLWKLQEYKSNLENLKKGLMQKLLTGQIRVKI